MKNTIEITVDLGIFFLMSKPIICHNFLEFCHLGLRLIFVGNEDINLLVNIALYLLAMRRLKYIFRKKKCSFLVSFALQ